jgi:hypothetical protein
LIHYTICYYELLLCARTSRNPDERSNFNSG